MQRYVARRPWTASQRGSTGFEAAGERTSSGPHRGSTSRSISSNPSLGARPRALSAFRGLPYLRSAPTTTPRIREFRATPRCSPCAARRQVPTHLGPPARSLCRVLHSSAPSPSRPLPRHRLSTSSRSQSVPSLRVLETTPNAITIEVTTWWRTPLEDAVERAGGRTREPDRAGQRRSGHAVTRDLARLRRSTGGHRRVLRGRGGEPLVRPRGRLLSASTRRQRRSSTWASAVVSWSAACLFGCFASRTGA